MELQELVQKFREFALPRVHFDCSMLQTRVEGADGVVWWRDVKCDEDEDDFEALWSTNWQMCDYEVGDEALFLPIRRPQCLKIIFVFITLHISPPHHPVRSFYTRLQHAAVKVHPWQRKLPKLLH
jgi:hypothetical protein